MSVNGLSVATNNTPWRTQPCSPPTYSLPRDWGDRTVDTLSCLDETAPSGKTYPVLYTPEAGERRKQVNLTPEDGIRWKRMGTKL